MSKNKLCQQYRVNAHPFQGIKEKKIFCVWGKSASGDRVRFGCGITTAQTVLDRTTTEFE